MNLHLCSYTQIHNTFGESHVHVLEVGKNEDSCSAECVRLVILELSGIYAYDTTDLIINGRFRGISMYLHSTTGPGSIQYVYGNLVILQVKPTSRTHLLYPSSMSISTQKMPQHRVYQANSNCPQPFEPNLPNR